MSDEENEIHTIARIRKEVANEAEEKYSRNIEKAKNIWWLIWGLITASFMGACWTTSLTMNLSTLQKEIDSETARLEKIELKVSGVEAKLDSYIASNNLVIQATRSLTDSLKSSTDESRLDIKEMRTKVDELWYMKQHGVVKP